MEFIFSNPTRHKKLGLSSINDSKGKQNAAQSDSEMVVHSISRVKSKRQQVSSKELLPRVLRVSPGSQSKMQKSDQFRYSMLTKDPLRSPQRKVLSL